ncbi:low-density lipoprotein receptor-related protein 2-like [Dreissena polymorpha]|uniref:low-density lipoprotein receptor-related protein 2-like n=1 Tax=Dreissena polymorpha TaxID=45954 RepID=UPI0022641225|nr:low-density lipoprotein receptor-related protein 2-like [Dreissena polymorpha]
MHRSLGFFLFVVYYASGLTDKPAANCTLTVTFQGLEIPDGGFVRATSGRLNQVYCRAYCTGPGDSPTLQFYRNENRISTLASKRIYSVRTTFDRNAILNVQDMIEADAGVYYCKGLINGRSQQRYFSLVFDPQLGSKQCEVSCTDGTCIVQTQLCDGSNNCEDGKDEFNCLDSASGNTELAENDAYLAVRPQLGSKQCEVSCTDGTCIVQTQLCDGSNNCEDGKDEFNCSDSGPQTKPAACAISCRDGICILQRQLCDGNDDCGDRSDEFNCTVSGKSKDPVPVAAIGGGVAAAVVVFALVLGSIILIKRRNRSQLYDNVVRKSNADCPEHTYDDLQNKSFRLTESLERTANEEHTYATSI